MTSEKTARDDTAQNNPSRPQLAAPRSIFSVPAPIKQLFDRFPLLSYPANDLPLRAPRHRDEHVLYVFATEDGARRGEPSFNPGCLKWQTYLKFSGIDFRLAASNNHASPSGALPFLLPASEGVKGVQPIPSGKLQKWAMAKSERKIEESGDMRYEAYLSLLDHRIRRAWLYSIYLSPNATSIAEPLYISPTSTSPFVRLAISHELRRAAETELLKYSSVINAELLYKDAEEALDALETLLGDHSWFFDNEKPGLFDASVFAYTHLLLDASFGGKEGWVDATLPEAALQRRALCEHRNRILAEYFPRHGS